MAPQEVFLKELDVSLNVVTEVQTLSELSSALGHPPGSGSHSRGDRHIARSGEFGESLWSLPSTAPPAVSLEEHLQNIRSQFPPECLSALAHEKVVLKEVFIDIGVFCEIDTFPKVLLTREDLQLVQGYGASLRIVYYPVEE